MPTLLDIFRQATQVDCDTLDADVAKNLGPFVDCTSNQAIAFLELSRRNVGQSQCRHDSLIKDAVRDCRGRLKNLQGEATFEEFVVETLMIKLQLLIAPSVTGFVHVQTNPKLSYSESGTIANAERIIAIFANLSPELDARRVCIKVPATWEGLQACRKLEAKGIATLATTVFCMEQATLAAHAKCTYIAPYVNELKVHFEQGYVDEHKAFEFCREAQEYYRARFHRTQVLAASLTSVDEVMSLAGIQHVTVSAVLLQQLATQDANLWGNNISEHIVQTPSQRTWETRDYEALVRDESRWKLAFTRSGFGASEGKIVQAINYFSDFQEKLEVLVQEHTD